MKWLIIILSIGIFVLLISKVKIKILYSLDNGKNNFKLKISYLFGLVQYEIDNCNKNKEKVKKGNIVHKRNSNLKGKEYIEIINYIKDKIIIEKFVWETKIGLEQPNYLSVIYGFIWLIKSLFINYLQLKNIHNININVIPYYNTNIFGIYLNCIIKIRMVNIINIWIRFIKLYKGGEKIVRTSNRRLDENYNE